MRAAALLLCALALAGCNGGEPAAPSGRPAEPPPEQPRTGPPPAWIETPEGSFWLGYSTYCWGGTCADYIAPACDSAPSIPAVVGEPVRVVFGFTARATRLTYFPSARQQPLDGREWIVESGGAFAVSAEAADGDASYAGCIVVSGGR